MKELIVKSGISLLTCQNTNIAADKFCDILFFANKILFASTIKVVYSAFEYIQQTY